MMSCVWLALVRAENVTKSDMYLSGIPRMSLLTTVSVFPVPVGPMQSTYSMYICMYTYVYGCTHICIIYGCMNVCIHGCMNVRMYIYVRIYGITYVRMYSVYKGVSTYVHMYVHTYVHT